MTNKKQQDNKNTRPEVNIFRSHYKILGVKKDASLAEITKVYRALSLKFHPDKNKNIDATVFAKISTAYDVLSDNVKQDFTIVTKKYADKDLSFQKVNGKVYWQGIPNIVNGKIYYKPNIQKVLISLSEEIKNLTPREYYDLQRSDNFKPTATQDLLNDLSRGYLMKLEDHLTAGADIDKALLFSLSKGNVDQIAKLIENGADANVLNSEGKAALLLAYNQQDQVMMKLLVQKGAETAMINKAKNSIITFKIVDDQVKVTEFVITGATAAAEDTPFTLACKALDLNAIKALSEEKGANINIIDPISKNSLLMSAIVAKQTDLAVYLISIKKAKLNFSNKEGKTASLLAYDQDNQLVLKLLFENNAESAVVDRVKNSVVIFKTVGDQVKGTEFPIEGIKAMSIDTPLTLALKASNFELVKALVDNGLDVNAVVPISKNTLVMTMVDAKQEDLVKLLSDKGADVNAINFSSRTALSKAYDQGNPSMVKLLKGLGAKPAVISPNKDNIVIVGLTDNNELNALAKFPIKDKSAKISPVASFNDNPIKFILDYYTKSGPTATAIEALHDSKVYGELEQTLDKTIICLEDLITTQDYGNTLNSLCGKDGSNIAHD